MISEAVSAGAAGYLAKDSLDRELISAVRTIVHVFKRVQAAGRIIAAGRERSPLSSSGKSYLTRT